ncbi:glycosyltransferase [Pseudoalteromonas sp. 120-MNA-CIBAN-0494]|uniref:glycosyltransferase n=1 Tax=unclassified Pseudoalteromonas TaxID=194690 RepID=UPI00332D1FDB
MKTINFIQDEATPHNNILIKNINAINEIKLEYALSKSNQYEWDIDLTNEIINANIYGLKVNLRLIKNYIKKSKKESFLMVGWSNPTTRIIFLLSVFFKLNLFMWFDLPDDNKKRSWLSRQVRSLFHFLLKKSNIQLFCAGKTTIDYFSSKGFSKSRLHNLPIQVEVVKEKILHFESNELKVFAGSRLTFDKGFDLLISALGALPKNAKVKLRLAGTGPEKEQLEAQVKALGLTTSVEFIGWLSPANYQQELAKSDIFIHPARVDAYGATVLALASGTPVIGSNGAGAVIDCLIDGENGYVYRPEDVEKLSELIMRFHDNQFLITEFSKKALLIANQYDGEYWAKQVIKAMK